MAAVPLLFLLVVLVTVVATMGADAVQTYSPAILLSASAVCLAVSLVFTRMNARLLWLGIVKSSRQILPAIPILVFIGSVAATWMYSGVVPTMIAYGLELLSPSVFLAMTCLVCAIVSVVSGSSWTTIATIGVAFIGIGNVLGYDEAWTAGAIISGAYFGDKVSPLSDTTVLASSTCGVDLFRHIRFLMLTSMPALIVALVVFTIVGFGYSVTGDARIGEMSKLLDENFNITGWTMIIPAMTVMFLIMRLGTATTLALSSLTGLIGIFMFQPQVVDALVGWDIYNIHDLIDFSFGIVVTETSLHTGHEAFDSLSTTGGVLGMVPTIVLVLSAMIFGGVMMGSGMIGTLTRSFIRRLRNARSLVGATVCSGLFLNGVTADQYLSLILGGNLYRKAYANAGLRPEVLSRSLEDSISVTSVLIPWNSCGVTQSTVLGVATLAYLPCCVFNYISPLMSIAMSWIGWKMKQRRVPALETETGAF